VGIIATLEPANLAVEPGAQASLTVRVRNGGTIVDRFELSVVGPLATWARAEPAALSLFPGQEGEAQVHFSPPREPVPRSGTYPYGVRVRAAADPGGATVEEGRVTVGPFTAPSAEIVPATSRGTRVGRHEVHIDNRGNAPLDVLVGAADPDRLVDFQVRPDRLVIEPGERSGVSIRASARDTFFLGSKQSHPFNVEVRPGKDPPIPLRGTLLQGPILPSWLVPVGGILAVALIALVVIPRLTGARDTGSGVAATLAPTASPSAEPSTGVSNAPATPSSGASEPLAGGSPSPSPSPSPGPFEIIIAGDTVSTGGALTPICPPEPEDSPCLRQALDTTQALATSLGGPFGGRGITNPNNTAVEDTLPVVMTRDVPFTWLAQDGTATDETDRLVVDLAPLIAAEPGFAYAVVNTKSGLPRRFVLPDPLARQLLEILYEPNPIMVDPLPDRTLPPIFRTFDPGFLILPPLIFATPTP
jgi:hypothetical protein